jgi:hypothetical protein
VEIVLLPSPPRGPAPGPPAGSWILDQQRREEDEALAAFYRNAFRGPELWHPPQPERRFVPLEEAAERMGMTTEQVLSLVRRGVLRATESPFGEIRVEPAIVSGPGVYA